MKLLITGGGGSGPSKEELERIRLLENWEDLLASKEEALLAKERMTAAKEDALTEKERQLKQAASKAVGQ